MVIINSRTEDDFVSIFYGLITWEKHPLELAHARAYLNDIRNVCYSLDSKSIHLIRINRNSIPGRIAQ